MALRVGAETLLFGVPEDTQRRLLAAPQVWTRRNPIRGYGPYFMLSAGIQVAESRACKCSIAGFPQLQDDQLHDHAQTPHCICRRRSSPAASAASSSPLPCQISSAACQVSSRACRCLNAFGSL